MTSSTYRRKPDIVVRRIAGDVLLVPVRSKLADMDRVFALNTVGEYAWERLEGKLTLAAIVDAVIDQFEVDRPVAEKDIAELVAELLEADLIEELP